MDKKAFNRPIDICRAKIADPFWGVAQETVRREVIPYLWEALNDRIPNAPPSFCVHNFRAAARMLERSKTQEFVWPSYTFKGFRALPQDPDSPDPDKHYGFAFQDSDFFKWVEAASYALANHPDRELESKLEEAVDIVCAAQHESGYLNTYYIVNGIDGAFTYLKDNHELYCLGHLIESAIALYQSTGKDKLLKTACRYAAFVLQRFGPEEGKCRGYPGHEELELALAKLYEATGKREYLELGRFFIDQRGTTPNFFLLEDRQRAEKNGEHYPPDDVSRYAYYQADKPVREQTEAVGHAVRAAYLYAGMADISRLTLDENLFAACGRLWDDIVQKKLYITGGIGSTAVGETFSFPYDLPNDTAYSETCAAIALAIFARRMLQICPKSEYADVMELALYNTVLAGMALDGKSFFYVNPLEVVPQACGADARLEHVKPVRQKWFGCACCPPNIARTVSSIAAYAFTENENTLFVHLYIGSQITKRVGNKELQLNLESEFPWRGSAAIRINAASPVRCTLAFRVPGWCKNYAVTLPDGIERLERNGYVYVVGTWKDGDQIKLDFPMEIHMRAANPNVREDYGLAAITRGPLCYCMEQADNSDNLHSYRLNAELAGAATEKIIEIGGRQMVLLELPGYKQEIIPGGTLYMSYTKPQEKPVNLKLIPYFAWANRGEEEMRVWLRI